MEAAITSASTLQRKSARIQSNQQNGGVLDYKCDKCMNGKIFNSLKGLRIHQSQNCIKSDYYRPSSYFCLSGEEVDKIFRLDKNSMSASDQSCSLEQNIFQENDFEDSHNVPYAVPVDISDTNKEENIDTEQHTLTNNPITTFLPKQRRICSFIFGDEFIVSRSFEEMVEAVQKHYENKNTKKSLMVTSSQNQLYQTCVESGISRSTCVKLLADIRNFMPRLHVPKTFHGMESRGRKAVNKLNDCVKIVVPWIKSWHMHELKGYYPVTIYIRSIFEVISNMLIDPELMFVWRNHIHFNYFRATDRKNNHIYSDLMTSTWAKNTEGDIRRKNPNGHLMPLIIYTDGVQVGSSVHNKITPIILSLGNFSDKLIQKDIAKRVIAYLPNLRCYSKDTIISHLMSKLDVSKTKVIHKHILSSICLLTHFYYRLESLFRILSCL